MMKRSIFRLLIILMPGVPIADVIDFKFVSRSYGDDEMLIRIDLAQGTADDGINARLRIHTVNDRYFYWTETSLDPVSQKAVFKGYALNHQTGHLTRGQAVDADPASSYMFNMECIRVP